MLLAHVQATRDESDEVTSNPDTAGRTEVSFLGLSPSVPIIQVIPFLVQPSGSQVVNGRILYNYSKSLKTGRIITLAVYYG